MRLFRIAFVLAPVVALPGFAQSASANTVTANSGFYDHQIIEYQATAEVTSSPQAAQLISAGNVVYHIVDANGTVPTVHTPRLLSALPRDPTGGNVINFLPTERGYTCRS